MDSDKWCKERLGLDGKIGSVPMEKLNSWGGSISLGHPFAASGLRLLSHAMNRMVEADEELALVSSCAMGGQGSAMLLERC